MVEKKINKTVSAKKPKATKAKSVTAKKTTKAVPVKKKVEVLDSDKNIFTAYFDAWKNYAVFRGRSSRYDFWAFTLTNIIITFLLSFAEIFAGLADVLSSLYSLAVLIPSLAIAARRLHDVNKSGWWMLFPYSILIILLFYAIISAALEYSGISHIFSSDISTILIGLSSIIGLIFFIGSFIYLLVLYCSAGDQKKNRFGAPVKEDPKYSGKSLSLIVITIVLVPLVLIILIGGIVGYTVATERFKISKSEDQIDLMVNNIKAVFSQSESYNGLNSGSLISYHIVPEDMHDESGSLINAFGGSIFVDHNEDTFIIKFTGVPEDACDGMMDSNFMIKFLPHLVGIRVNQGQQFLPNNIPDSICSCKDYSCEIEWEFK